MDGGALLGPETVRKLACDAAVIPAVLDADGQVLDLGRTRRLFTPAQVQALWLRDRHCTFPGCQTPASWCDAHHVTHWVDGGPTDLTNAALLCGRHHTIVHRDRLTATLTTSDQLTSASTSNADDRETGHAWSGTDGPAATTRHSPADPHPAAGPVNSTARGLRAGGDPSPTR